MSYHFTLQAQNITKNAFKIFHSLSDSRRKPYCRTSLKTKSIHQGRRKFIGKLIDCDDSSLSIVKSNNSEEITFKFSDIDLCRLKPDYNNLLKEYSYGE